jgi:hypothetical protein
MTEPLPGRPIRSSAPHRLERFQVHLFLVLGIALVGAGLTIIGFASISPSVVGLGAGIVAAAGLIAVYFALAGSRQIIGQKGVSTDATSMAPLTRDPAPESQPLRWDNRPTSLWIAEDFGCWASG